MDCFTGQAKTKDVVLTVKSSGSSSCIGCASFGVGFPRLARVSQTSVETLTTSEAPTCFHCALLLQIHDALKVVGSMADDPDITDPLVNWIRGQQTNSRVVKLSSNRETPTYAAVLLQEEAIHHDCHQVGTCKVTWDNHRVRIQCRSGKCAKIHSYVTDDESKMCAHAKKILEHIRDFEPNILEGSSLHASSKTTTTVGVTFDATRGCWFPDEYCSTSNIPEFPSAEAIVWFSKRATMNEIERDSGGNPKRDERGCFVGKPCFGMGCQKCENRITDEQHFIEVGTIVIHTTNGPVARKKFSWTCSCGNAVMWDPSHEHIHTIRNGAEGGERLTLVFDHCFV